MKTTIQRQQGLTLISLIFVLGIFAFFMLLLFKIAPIYLDHAKVKNALAAIEETVDIETYSESEIRSSLDKRFNLNYVEDIKSQDVKIIKQGSYIRIHANYEVVEKIVGNLSVLVTFDDLVEIGKE
jgi:Domain of unknown function (DUF4845)